MESVAELKDMKSWTDRLGHTKLRTFTEENGHFWLEQNPAKPSKWAKLAREGHEVAWEFDSPGGSCKRGVGEIDWSAQGAARFGGG